MAHPKRLSHLLLHHLHKDMVQVILSYLQRIPALVHCRTSLLQKTWDRYEYVRTGPVRIHNNNLLVLKPFYSGTLFQQFDMATGRLQKHKVMFDDSQDGRGDDDDHVVYQPCADNQLIITHITNHYPYSKLVTMDYIWNQDSKHIVQQEIPLDVFFSDLVRVDSLPSRKHIISSSNHVFECDANYSSIREWFTSESIFWQITSSATAIVGGEIVTFIILCNSWNGNSRSQILRVTASGHEILAMSEPERFRHLHLCQGHLFVTRDTLLECYSPHGHKIDLAPSVEAIQASSFTISDRFLYLVDTSNHVHIYRVKTILR